jgi:HlyD family secretion protein
MTATTRRRWIVWVGLALIGLVLLVVAVAPRAVQVDLGEVTTGPLEVTIDHEGMTRVKDRFAISAPVAGTVQRIEHEPGDPVVAGDTVLATFVPAEPVLLDSRSRAEALARVEAARADLEQARAERERADSLAQLAATDLVRIRSLAEDGVVSSSDLDQADTNARAGAQQQLAAEAAAEAARHALEAAHAALIEPVGEPRPGAPTALVELHSPVDGVVLRRLRESAAVVAQGEPLLEVADAARLEIIADFLSKDAVRMAPGMPVHLAQWGGDDLLKAHVRRVEPSGFTKISALGVEEQRVWVVIELDEPPQQELPLGDGYRVEAQVVVWSTDSVLRVPTAALFRERGVWSVFVFERGHARLRTVDIGHRTGLLTEVVGGLDEGARVVVHPPDAVADGVRVRERG